LGLNNWRPSGVELPANPIIEIDGAGMSEQDVISKAILHTYDIRNDDRLSGINLLILKNSAAIIPRAGNFPHTWSERKM